jgi:hypothetical protein
MFSASLSDDAIKLMAVNLMPFLSAIDDHAWSWITRGWELTEYVERKRERRVRENQLREIEDTEIDDEKRAARRALAIEEWPKRARSRRRNRGEWWWSGGHE